MTPTEILMKHEDANEYHFHEVDRKWIIEAMEEYATISKRETVDKEKSVIPINLYTEEQVLNALRLAHSHIKPLQYVVHTLKPISLPSDEEIKKEAKDNCEYNQDSLRQFDSKFIDTFIEGAKWMKEQIKQQII